MKESPVYQLVKLVWKNASVPSHAQLNRSLQSALTLAIESKMKFAKGDFAAIRKAFSGQHWMGSSLEGWYTMAICAKNTSACVSFEASTGRSPFRYGRQRLHIRSILYLPDGTLAVVTSFSKDGKSLLACVYDSQATQYVAYGAKVVRRVRLTCKDVRDLGRKVEKKLETA